jgi:hypothetical protein
MKGNEMAHLLNNSDKERKTPSEWLGVGSSIGKVVNNWSLRDDLVVFVGEELSADVPALYDPAKAEIEVNTKIAFGNYADPTWIGDFTDRDCQFDFPRATGAIFHESLHARFTRWSLEQSNKDLEPRVNEILHLLEEGRIEAMGVRVMPENKEFLRTSALEIVLASLDESEEPIGSVRGMAKVASLVGARIDAGVLRLRDVEDVIDLLKGGLGEALYDELRSIWCQAQNHYQHSNAEPLYALAKMWDKLVEEEADKRGEPKGGSGSGEGGISVPADSPLGKAIKEALDEAKDQSEIGANSALADQQTKEDWEKEAKEKANSAKQQHQHKQIAEQVFGRKADGTSEMGTSSSSSKLKETRKPTSAERVGAVKIAQMLEKAKYRERDLTIVGSVIPAGKLRTRALVQAQALKERGVLTPVQAWRKKTRKQTDEPTLTIGVMVDVSGSMGNAMNPMASMAWIMSEASKRVQAKSAMVYYGQDVFPTLRVGERLDEVRVYTAPDGTEKFDKAFQALNGSLDLLYGSGARLLVVVSDGAYTTEEQRACKKWIKECDKNGVAVVWLNFDKSWGEGYIKDFLNGTTGEYLLIGDKPEEVATEIGKRASKSLSAIGKRNA